MCKIELRKEGEVGGGGGEREGRRKDMKESVK